MPSINLDSLDSFGLKREKWDRSDTVVQNCCGQVETGRTTNASGAFRVENGICPVAVLSGFDVGTHTYSTVRALA